MMGEESLLTQRNGIAESQIQEQSLGLNRTILEPFPLCSYLCSENLNEKIFVHYFRRLYCAVLPLSNPKPHLSSMIWAFVRVDTGTKGGHKRDSQLG